MSGMDKSERIAQLHEEIQIQETELEDLEDELAELEGSGLSFVEALRNAGQVAGLTQKPQWVTGDRHGCHVSPDCPAGEAAYVIHPDGAIRFTAPAIQLAVFDIQPPAEVELTKLEPAIIAGYNDDQIDLVKNVNLQQLSKEQLVGEVVRLRQKVSELTSKTGLTTGEAESIAMLRALLDSTGAELRRIRDVLLKK